MSSTPLPSGGKYFNRSGAGKKLRRAAATARQKVAVKRSSAMVGKSQQTTAANIRLGVTHGITGRVGAILHKARLKDSKKR